MALKTRLNAVHGINRYLYEKGKNTVFPSESVYGGRTAFAPVDSIADYSKMQMPVTGEGRNKSVPYIVYNWSIPSISTDWFMQTEQIIYLIYSTEIEDIRRMSNYIVDNMKQYDRSATNVQAWLETLPATEWGGLGYNPYLNLEIYSISVENAGGPTPIEEANGRMEALITLNVSYGLVGGSVNYGKPNPNNLDETGKSKPLPNAN